MQVQAVTSTIRESESPWLVPLYGVTILLSAALLFVVQPMFAKMVLPQLGGTPAAWNTCLLFFQVVLLLGYFYAHLTTVGLSRRAQVALHLLVMGATLLVLPIGLRPGAPPAGSTPIWWLLAMLATSVGLPFFTVAATAPLIQRWFSHASGRDPYFLYAASNFGSLVGLLGYPFALERILRLSDQSLMWLGGFVALTLLIAACGVISLRATGSETDNPALSRVDALASAHDGLRESWRTRATWLVLAFVPSSLLLGVTTHISTDVAAVPLLWVIPLALYLLTFIAAFASRPPFSRVWTSRAMPLLIVAAVAALIANQRGWWWLGVHLLSFATVALVCHRELAERRPPAEHLTRFYLWVSLGGALGGMFNALIAPVIFTRIVEFPLVMVVAAFLRPSPRWRAGALEPWAVLLGMPLIAFGAVVISSWFGLASDLGIGTLMPAFWFCAALALAFANRVQAFAIAVGILVLSDLLLPRERHNRVVFEGRSFFGVHRVLEDTPPTKHRLIHGTTLHGWQSLALRDQCAPTGYYDRNGPVGQLFAALGDSATRVGVIGLGAGSLVCYAEPAAKWTYFEIDPDVERLARDPALFTFLRNTTADVDVVIGDGRLMLTRIDPGTFDVLVIDAYSSDAIPMHLVTQEFMLDAIDRLVPGGVLAFHISNVYLDLEPAVTAAVASAGATALVQSFNSTSEDGLASQWMIASRDPERLAVFAADARWKTAKARGKSWTDDFSNIFDVIKWGR
jgi:spermidine synthase